tara:strand:+ start:1165 stop:1407 length:243 start_codon:yes stop_codon:yes gene_type:complete
MEFSKTNWEDLKIGDEILVHKKRFSSHYKSGVGDRDIKNGDFVATIDGFTRLYIRYDGGWCDGSGRVEKKAKDSTWRLYE